MVIMVIVRVKDGLRGCEVRYRGFWYNVYFDIYVFYIFFSLERWSGLCFVYVRVGM